MTDALALHRAALGRLDWCSPPDGLARRLGSLRPVAPLAACPDPHARLIATWDAGRSPLRAVRMGQALNLLREWAASGRPVCWQEQVGFRGGPAWAKGGLERYGYWPGLKDEFARKVADDDADGAHPVAKAVRLYLDLCFYHPFPNGNARAARLWFDYQLRRGGHVPAFVEPLFVVERFAGDVPAYVDFLRLALLSCEQAQRRLSGPSSLPNQA